MLKNSERNCNLKRSVSWKSLKSEKSSLRNGGPETCVGGPPKAPRPVKTEHPATEVGSGVPAAPNLHGWEKAAGLPNQLNTLFESVCSPSFGLCPLTTRS